MRTIRVTVSERLIAKGRQGDPYRCPIGYALDLVLFQGDVGQTISTAIGRSRAESRQFGAIIGGKWVKYPGAVSDWVMAYDAGEPVKPISFNLTVPDAPEPLAC